MKIAHSATLINACIFKYSKTDAFHIGFNVEKKYVKEEPGSEICLFGRFVGFYVAMTLLTSYGDFPAFIG